MTETDGVKLVAFVTGPSLSSLSMMCMGGRDESNFATLTDPCESQIQAQAQAQAHMSGDPCGALCLKASLERAVSSPPEDCWSCRAAVELRTGGSFGCAMSIRTICVGRDVGRGLL